MSSPYLSEIRMMGFNYAPRYWAQCNGTLMSISQNQPLFALIGTAYGGDGRTTFGLPNLQGQAPVHMGNGFSLGQVGGEATHTLIQDEMASHNHIVNAVNAAGNAPLPGTSRFLAQGIAQNSGKTPVSMYGSMPATTAFASTAISLTGNSQPHPNMQPYLVVNFCISLAGIYPSRN